MNFKAIEATSSASLLVLFVCDRHVLKHIGRNWTSKAFLEALFAHVRSTSLHENTERTEACANIILAFHFDFCNSPLQILFSLEQELITLFNLSFSFNDLLFTSSEYNVHVPSPLHIKRESPKPQNLSLLNCT